MGLSHDITQPEPARAEIDALRGPVVLEFGTSWCGFCRAAQPLIHEAFKNQQAVRHIKVEDGKGLALGRSFAVKLWPTLVFMRDGKELERLVRPDSVAAISKAMALFDAPA